MQTAQSRALAAGSSEAHPALPLHQRTAELPEQLLRNKKRLDLGARNTSDSAGTHHTL